MNNMSHVSARFLQSFICVILLLSIVFFSPHVFADSVLLLPGGIKTIEDEAFYGDSSIREVIIPEGAVTIGKKAFANSGVTKINVPASVSSIADDAFDGVKNYVITSPKDTVAYYYAQLHTNATWENVEKLTFTIECPETIRANNYKWYFKIIPSKTGVKYKYQLKYTYYSLDGNVLRPTEYIVQESKKTSEDEVIRSFQAKKKTDEPDWAQFYINGTKYDLLYWRYSLTVRYTIYDEEGNEITHGSRRVQFDL